MSGTWPSLLDVVKLYLYERRAYKWLSPVGLAQFPGKIVAGSPALWAMRSRTHSLCGLDDLRWFRMVLKDLVALIALIVNLANYRHLSSAYGGRQQIPRQWRSWRPLSGFVV